MTEESLDQLFASARLAPAETRVEDVAGWIDAAVPSSVRSSPSGKGISFKSMHMATVSVLTATVTAILLYFTGVGKHDADHKDTPAPSGKQVIVPADTARQLIFPDPLPQPVLHPRLSSRVDQQDTVATFPPASDTVGRSVPDERSLATSDSHIVSVTDTTKRPASNGMGNEAGVWKSEDGSLKTDTVFSGVRSLVISGLVGSVSVRGSSRNDVAMNFEYAYRAKGVYFPKDNAAFTLSYDKRDTVLEIHFEGKNRSKSVLIGSVKETNKADFQVPEHIAVIIDTRYGDIAVSGLHDNEFRFKTDYGDIHAEDVSGNIQLASGYGDIELSRIRGRMDANTGYGDIRGKDLVVVQQLTTKSGYGDIDLHIGNPTAECRFDLKTGFGKVKMKRADMELDASGKLVFGTGSVLLSAKSGMGDIIIR